MQQGITTLIYGNNEDSDNQGSNGSGKSSLNEAIAIALLGSPLRKCTSSEIINDDADECQIQLWMKNPSLNQELYIGRKFFRKDSSICVVQTWFNGEEKELKLSGVSEYNKFIIDALGVSKDDLLNYVILSKYTYKNFLSASDKEKKEIINSFSGGNKVDEAIALLNLDKEEELKVLGELNSNVDTLKGKVSALNEQIVNESETKEERKKQLKSKIDEAKSEISGIRSDIRQAKSNQSEKLEKLTQCERGKSESEAWANEVRDLENVDFIATKIIEKGKSFGVDLGNFVTEMDEIYHAIGSKTEELESEKDSQQLTEKRIQKENESMYYLQGEIEKENELLESKRKKAKKDLDDVQLVIVELNKKRRSLSEDIENTRSRAYKLQAIIKGAVKCPKCNHEFLLDPSVDLEQSKTEYEKVCAEGVALKSQHDSIKAEVESKHDTVSALQNAQMAIPSASPLTSSMDDLKRNLNSLNVELDRYKRNIANISAYIEDADTKVIKVIDKYIDRVLDLVDDSVDEAKREHRNATRTLESLESDLSVSESRLSQFETLYQEDNETSLKSALNGYKDDLLVAEQKASNQLGIVNKMVEQEQIYIQYKTHLANSKIEALSQVTNSFLSDIGSELRVQFVGFKVLKSGKVRDKISVNLLRNGEEVGSYGKLSVGEQGRINLACILAMNKLVNMNCEANKGINVLILDEILDGIDESGLNSILDALNETGLTSLVVSHGKTSESYPHTVTITKKHGESTIG